MKDLSTRVALSKPQPKRRGLRKLARQTLAGFVDRYGYELKLQHHPPRGLRGSMARLIESGFRPATILDVGVGRGTRWLYESFPDAHFRLFEPVEEFLPWLERIGRQYRADYELCAIGAETGTAEILVNQAMLTCSTMQGYTAELQRWHGWRDDQLVPRAIPCRRLDDLGPFEAPLLLKIDTEGHELEVMQGARATLEATEIIVSEVSVAPRNASGYSLGEFLSAVEEMGFALIDIAQISTLRQGGPIAYLDAVFARADSRFRY